MAAVGMIVAAVVPATAAAAASGVIEGNATCRQLLGTPTAYEIKVEAESIENGAAFGPVTFKDVNAAKTLMGYISTAPIDAVFVKGGPVGGYLYDYGSTPRTTDTNMGTGGYGIGRFAISHVSFCWNQPPAPPPSALGVTKTATAGYTGTVSWDLTKTVDVAEHTGVAGGSAGSSTWTVTATKNVAESDFRVSGTITVTNPNPAAVPVTVTDTLDDGTSAVVTCPATSVPARTSAGPGTLTCTYEASPGDREATRNNVVVTSGTPGVAGATADVPFTWAGTRSGPESVTLADPRFDHSESISASTTRTFQESFPCSPVASDYANGSDTRTETNTATLRDGANLTRTATVQVTCTLAPLTATKTATGTYDNTIGWSLAKSVDNATQSGAAGESAGTSTWTVTATRTDTPSNHRVTGDIVISNPSAITVPVSVTDRLSDGTVAQVSCPSTSVPARTAAGAGELTCTYSAAPADGTATRNTATVTGEGNAPVQAQAPLTFTPRHIGAQTVALADPRFDHQETVSVTTTRTFPESFPCSWRAADYTNGSHTRTETNTATLTGAGVDLTESANVGVTCTLAPLGAAKTAAGAYDNRIAWALTKTVNPSSHAGLAGQVAGSSTWTVTATKSQTQENHRVTGSIILTNSSAIEVPVTVTDRLDNGTVVPVTCPRTTVPARSNGVDGTVTCTYTASQSNATAESNTATVNGAGNAPVTATAPVTWSATNVGDPSVTLADPRFSHSETISATTTKTFPESFGCPTSPTQYTNGLHTRTETNTATLTGATTNHSASANVTVTCRPFNETATGAGTRWPGTSNWFMYTPYTTSKVDLIAGQHMDAGDIQMVAATSTTTTITITLHAGFQFAGLPENVKIHPMSSAPKSYLEPGRFSKKFSAGVGTTTYRATVPTASFYGIHVDVLRYPS